MSWAPAKHLVSCYPHFTVEEIETLSQEETISPRPEALLLKVPTHPAPWALTSWGELVKVGLPQEVLVCAGATTHFLKPNPIALRESKHPKDRQDLVGPPRPGVSPKPTREHPRGTGTGMRKNQ